MFKRTGFGLAFALIATVCLLAFFVVQATQAAPPRIEAARGSVIILQQDGTPIPEPTVSLTGDTPAPVSDLTDKLITDVESFLGTYGGLVGLAASFIVGLLGSIPALANVPKRIINLGVSGLLVAGLLLTSNFGYGTQFQGALDAIPVIGKTILALLVAFGFSTGVHEAASVYSVPVWGSKRTPRG